MKYRILPLAALLALSTASFAQTDKAYAVTSETKGHYIWNVIREVDLSTGKVIRTLYAPNQAAEMRIQSTTGDKFNANNAYITSNGVAATAYDAAHNRLYFTPMRGQTLNYLDLTTGKTVVLNGDQNFNTGNKGDEANVITRMCMGADGNGYALTNDGNQLLRFTTGEKPQISKLGQLIDGKKNNGISIHNLCTSWGGDMIADAYGNLWVLTMRNNVFKVNPNTLVADHVGAIKGLPADFTTNGAAVDKEGQVVVSSSVLTKNYYRINLSTLVATAIENEDGSVFNASDLASRYVAYADAKSSSPFALDEVKGNQFVSVYPNPVTNAQLNVTFNKLPAGNYNVEIMDLSGKRIQSNLVATRGIETQRLVVTKGVSKGMYVLKVTNAQGETVYSDKLWIQ